MRLLCLDGWYSGRDLATDIAKRLEVEGDSYTIGLVESPMGAWGILYMIDQYFCAYPKTQPYHGWRCPESGFENVPLVTEVLSCLLQKMTPR